MPAGTGIASLRWRSTSIDLQISPPAPSSDISVGELQRIVSEAISSWRAACPDCNVPSVSIHVLGARRGAQLDGLNVLTFQTGSWCPERRTGDCYNPKRAAITHHRPSLDGTQAGVLAEADIEINAAHFKWSPDGSAPGTVSLRAVITHEIGHFFGLPHSLDPSALMFPHPVDQAEALPFEPTKQDVNDLRALYADAPGHAPSPWTLIVGVITLIVAAAALLWVRQRR